MDWFYVQNGSPIGPVPVGQFEDLVRSGRITRETLVWRESQANWQPFGSITADPSSLPSPPAPRPLPGVPGVLTACAECGLTFPQSEMIPFAGSWICAKCKSIFLQRLREGAPLAAGGADAWQSDEAVVTLHGGTLPARCAKCYGPVSGKPIERRFYWTPGWVFSLILIPPIYLIAYLFLGKRARVSVPICEECRWRRRVFLGVSWFLLVIGIGVEIAAVAYDLYSFTLLALVSWLAALYLGFSKGMLVYTKKIDAQFIWVSGFCEAYRASLPEFPKLP